jgi:hypothetical protein
MEIWDGESMPSGGYVQMFDATKIEFFELK